MALPKIVSAIFLGFLLSLVSGCSIVYIAQSVQGHLEVVAQSRPVESWLAEPTTPEAVKERLRLAQRLRAFAVEELKLPDHASYRRYATLNRSAVVWNVVAAPELSLEPKTWCYPVVGCVAYRGYFDLSAARDAAQTLREQGLEVHVAAVPAYSTLGKTDWLGGDPLLDTFLFWDEAALARLIFHEMAHPAVFIPGDTAFNESFATAVERLGLKHWSAVTGRVEPLQADAARETQRAAQRAGLKALREALRAVYQSPVSVDKRRQAKAQVLERFRQQYPQISAELTNNAALALQGAYQDAAPAFERLFEAQGRDFVKFYEAARRLSGLPAVLGAVTP